ncbi:MAG: hypothetical protein N3G20_10945 [Verrucomicrobiae bacterium]|nr:hypothetical protein [Verrucomicrobiae bacterium]
MYSLAKLVRGLSALFWGMPVALVVCVQTAKTGFFDSLGVVPPILTTGVLYYGVNQLRYFRDGERVWQLALSRAKTVALINTWLSPFLYWWRVMPEVLHYRLATLALATGGLVFLVFLNLALQRLAAMLPDETLKLETQLFTTMNLWLIGTLALFCVLWGIVSQVNPNFASLIWFLAILSRAGIFIFLLLLLLPLALTMTLIWKIKELILSSVFSGREP